MLEVSRSKLNGESGFFSILHTWGRTLSFHPHIHVVVPGGVWSNNEWKSSSEKFLLPVRILSTVFRGKFVHKIKQQKLLDSLSPSLQQALLKQLYEKPWVVYSKPPFGGKEAVLKYLARYTHRIAISNSRLASVTKDRVVLKYKDAKDQKEKLLTLTPLEFTRRFLQHVPVPGFVRIRYYGFLSHAKKKTV